MKISIKVLISLFLIALMTVSLKEASGADVSNGNKNINEAVVAEKYEAILAFDAYGALPENEVINTLYPDPFSDEFMDTKNESLNRERNRSTSELVDEFERQASVINENTEIPDEIVEKHTKEEKELIELKTEKILKGVIEESKNVQEENTEGTPSANDDEVYIVEVEEEKAEKLSILEPVLLYQGKPKDKEGGKEKTVSFTGILTPEKHYIKRGKHMIRWVLTTEDGTKIPLKSNLKLLQEVRKGDVLDDYVTVKGKFKTSAFEKELKYLVLETLAKSSSKTKLDK